MMTDQQLAGETACPTTPRAIPSSFSRRHQLGRVLWGLVYVLTFRPSPKPFHAWRRWLLRLFGAHIASDAAIYPSVKIWAPWNLTMHRLACLAPDVDCYSVAPITLGERAKQRSVHNSYMTFPLLFIMLSNHFPATYASPVNWLVLLLLFVAGASVRHAMIGRGSSSRWALLPAGLALAAAMFLSTPKGAAAPATAAAADSVPPFHAVRAVIAQRCQPCHSQYQSDRTLGPAPGGVTFDTPESIARLAERIRVRAVETKTMPLANKTGMTEEERALLARWISGGAPLR